MYLNVFYFDEINKLWMFLSDFKQYHDFSTISFTKDPIKACLVFPDMLPEIVKTFENCYPNRGVLFTNEHTVFFKRFTSKDQPVIRISPVK